MTTVSRREFIRTSASAVLLPGALTAALEPGARSGSSPWPAQPPRHAGVWPRLLTDDTELAALRRKLPQLPPAFTRLIPNLDALPSGGEAPAFYPNGQLAAYEMLHAAWLALLHRVTNEPAYLQAARRFLPAILELRTKTVPMTAGGNNGDLMIGHWLLAVSLYHDWLHDVLTPEEASAVRAALAVQARAAHAHFTAQRPTWAFEQNHVFIGVAGLGVAGFALWGAEPDAAQWIETARHFMRRGGDALCADGFYYEGVSYFTYAFHWHVIFAAVQRRVLGEDWFQGQPFTGIEQFVLHHTLPGGDFAFDFADWGPRQGQPGYDKPWHSVPTRWSVWSLLGLRRFRGPSATLDTALRQLLGRDYSLEKVGIFHLLWSCEDVVTPSTTPAPDHPTFHHFTDHDVLVWRENWRDKNATAIWLKCGPPEGHRAASLLRAWPNWRPNAGHAHPDAGHFMLWSRGRFLAGDTGYTGIKRSRDHNTLLIDGDGQFRDGRYHAFDSVDYARLDAVRLRQVELSEKQMVATCELTDAYDTTHAVRELQRRVLFREGRLLVISDRWVARDPKIITWLWHTDEKPVQLDANRWLIQNGPASIVLIILSTVAQAIAEPALVPAYTGTPDRNPDWRQRGWRLVLTTPPIAQGDLMVAGVLNPPSPDQAKASLTDGKVRFY